MSYNTMPDDAGNAQGEWWCTICAARERISNDGMDACRLHSRPTVPQRRNLRGLRLPARGLCNTVPAILQRLRKDQTRKHKGVSFK